MKEINTEFDATLLYGYDKVTGLEGLIIESRGGSSHSNNYRNPEHSLLLAFVLKKIQNKGFSDLQIYVASKSKSYINLEDRLIKYNGHSIIELSKLNDFDIFLKSVKKSIKKSGQSPKSTGGNSTKRLLLISNTINLSQLFENDLETIINSENEDQVEYIHQKVKKRLKQSKFRKELLVTYNNTCAVTGSQVFNLLDAAHIIPYFGEKSNVLTNGILLRTDIHELFDTYKEGRRLLNITLDYIIEIHPDLKGSEYWRLNGKKISLPLNENDYPNF